MTFKITTVLKIFSVNKLGIFKTSMTSLDIFFLTYKQLLVSPLSLA